MPSPLQNPGITRPWLLLIPEWKGTVMYLLGGAALASHECLRSGTLAAGSRVSLDRYIVQGQRGDLV